jgi:hypothetical protein
MWHSSSCGLTTANLMSQRRLVRLVLTLAAGSALVWAAGLSPEAQQAAPTDLDRLMERALGHRDQNWKKLNQYVLDEREQIDVRAPNETVLFGDEREYTWYIRDGIFLRSPVRANGVGIPEGDRRKYEREWLEREKRRERAAARGAQRAEADAQDASIPGDIGGLLQQSREPRFISAGYFLEFKFEPGNYFLAGRETLDGRELLRVEYFPTRLFGDDNEQRRRRNQKPPSARDREMQEKMNKTALVTLWVEPATAEIRKYTFDNLGLGFLPLSWLVRVSEMRANVNMLEPFEGILLPGTVDIRVAVSLANGTYHLRYDLEYYGYKQARVRSTLLPPR